VSRRLALILEYQGTRYHGFQVQPQAPTVQGELERALARLLGEHVKTQGAGRTDAGAHARGQVVAFTTQARYPPEVFARALNAFLPEDIRVQAACEVEPDFDPRRHATSREYHYLVLNRERPSALWREFAYQVPGPLDVEAMQEAAASLVGRHDLRAFTTLGGGALRNPRRRVFKAQVQSRYDLVTLAMEAESFLPHQVRRTAGALVRVGQGEMRVEEFRQLLEERRVGAAGPALPARGLFLMRASYPGFPPGSLIQMEHEPWPPLR
jgi:tRNA pseudouridine38-40 synthase